MTREFSIKFDTNGETEISNIVVKNNKIIELFESSQKEGNTFTCWTNDKGEVITKRTKDTIVSKI